MRWLDAAARGARLVRARATGALVPFHVILCVTARCNLRCVYCSCPSRRDGELTTGEWRAVLDECRALGTERVQFFGGEPLLRDDLHELAAHARRLGMRCVLATNGVLVPRRRNAVMQMHTVVLSLDGGHEAHDTNRGRGSHRATLRAIAALREWRVPVKVNAVVNANNADQLEWLADFTASERIPLTINVMRSASVGLWEDASAHRLSDAGMRGVIDRVVAIKRRFPHILISRSSYEVLRRWPDFTIDRMTREEGGDAHRGPACSAGRLHCMIYSDGRLFPCALTVKQLPALDVRRVGVAAALASAAGHSCTSCASACMIEMNSVFALDPRVLLSLGRAYLTRGLE